MVLCRAENITAVPSFSERSCGIYEGACRYAEVQLAALALNMKSKCEKTVRAWRIITHQGEPLLLQKTQGEKTALALSKVAIENVEYPAGSLLALHVTRDLQPAENKYRTEIALSEMQVVPSQEVVGLSFLRPSLFAFEPVDRQSYLRNLDGACAGYTGTAEFLAGASLRNVVDISAAFL